MSKLIYALLGAGALAALAALDSRLAEADTLSVSSSSSVGSSSGGGNGSALDCTHAVASLGVIWPPDHKMVAVTLLDVDDTVTPTIKVTGIQQDEPINALGSGNTAPDGSISSDGTTAYLRAERAGPGTGRLYFVSFDVTDSNGGSCSVTVQAFVPHDQGQGFTPVDTGMRYDSTVLAN